MSHWANMFAYMTRICCIGCKYGRGSQSIHHCMELECQCKTVNKAQSEDLFPAFAFDLTSIISISVLFSLLLYHPLPLIHYENCKQTFQHSAVACDCMSKDSVLGAGTKESHSLLIDSPNTDS